MQLQAENLTGGPRVLNEVQNGNLSAVRCEELPEDRGLFSEELSGYTFRARASLHPDRLSYNRFAQETFHSRQQLRLWDSRARRSVSSGAGFSPSHVSAADSVWGSLLYKG